MEENQETIADIIAEKRRRADEIESDCAEKMKRGEMVSDCYARELVADIREKADRLEAARKREVDKLNSAIHATVGRSDAEIDRLRREIAELKQAGNAAKLREVCEQFLELLADPAGFEDGGMDVELDENQVVMWRNRFRAALAATEKEGGAK